MYKLIIADDEKSIREGMSRGIPWEEWGFTVAGTASDGLEVLEMIAKDKPDVVLSDIRMPNMDGVELMQYLNQNYPEIKIIIASGYSDFEYLNYSIKNNVTEYLLKPTDIDEFESVFSKIKNLLDKERKQEYNYRQSQNYHLDRVLSDMMLGYESEDSDEIDYDILKETGINADNCVVIMLYAEWQPEFRDETEFNKIRRKIVDRINAMEKHKAYSRFFIGYQDKMMGIMSPVSGQELSEYEIYNCLKNILDVLNKEMGIEIYACVSKVCNDRRLLPQCRQQAIAEAHRNSLGPDNRIGFYHPVKAKNNLFGDAVFDNDKIMNCIVSGKGDKADEEIDRVFAVFENADTSEQSYIENSCLELLFYLSRKSLPYNINFEQVMEDSGFRYDDLRRLVSLSAKKNMIKKSIAALIDCVSLAVRAEEKNSNLAKRIKDYVDSEYLCNHISLEYIANKVNKSSAYVSRLFKDEYGCNFSEYITSKRLEKSKEMLADKSIKIYEIAQNTGYADVSNFIKVFKKKYGISPGDYRNFVK